MAGQHQEPVPSCEVAGGGTPARVPLAWHSLRRKGAPNSSRLLLSLGPSRRSAPFRGVAVSLATGPQAPNAVPVARRLPEAREGPELRFQLRRKLVRFKAQCIRPLF